MRAFNNQSPSTSLASSNGPLKQKHETGGGSIEFSKAVAGTTDVPLLHGDVGKNFISNIEGQTLLHKGQEEPLKTDGQYEGTDHQTTASLASVSLELPAASVVNSQLQSTLLSENKDRCTNVAPNITNSLGFSAQSYGTGLDKVMNVSPNGNIQNLCTEMASLNIDRHIGAEPSGHTRPDSSLSDNTLVTSPRNQGMQQCFPEKVGEPSTSIALGKALASTDDIHTKREQSDLRSDFLSRESGWRSDSQTRVPTTDLQVEPPEAEKDLQYFEDQRLKDPELVTSYFPNPSHSFHHSGHSGLHSLQQNEPFGSRSFNRPHVLDNKVNKGLLLHPSGVPMVPNRYPEDIISNSVDLDRAVEHSYLFPSEVNRNHSGRFEVEAGNSNQNVATDMLGESNIISNILSLDFDAWDETLTSPQNLAKFLGETDRLQGSLKSSNSWKAQNSSQSRFPFARYDEPKNQVSNVKTSLSNIGQVLKDDPSTHDFAENKYFNFDKFGDGNGFSAFNIEEPNNFPSSYSHLSPNKLSGEF